MITDPQKYPDEYYVEVMDSMYLPAAESYNGLRTIDVSKLKFRYSEANLNDAVKKKEEKISIKRLSQLKSILIPQYGLKTLLTLIMNQCIMITSGTRLMMIIL